VAGAGVGLRVMGLTQDGFTQRRKGMHAKIVRNTERAIFGLNWK